MIDQNIRLTEPALRMLRFFLIKPQEGRSGAEISKAAKIGSGTLYPLLARLESAGWLKSEWENVDPSEVGRPRRRFYRLTGLGYRNSQEALRELQIIHGEPAWVS